MIQPKRIKDKKNYRSNFFRDVFAFFSRKIHARSFSGKKRSRKKKITITQESLGDFLREYEVINPRSLGRQYWRRRNLVKIWLLIKKTQRKILNLFKKITLRGIAIGLLAIIMYGSIPGALSAPHSVSVVTMEDWKRGEATSLDVSDSNGQIQLQPDGSWNKRVWGVPQEGLIAGGFSTGSSSVKVGNYIYIVVGNSTRVWYRYDILRDSYDTLNELPFMAGAGANLDFDGISTIYMTFGAYSKKFYKYDVVNETFTQLPDTQDTICSGSNVKSNGTDVFVNRGCGGTDFWKFKVSTGIWENLAPVKAGPSAGASIVLASDGNFYMTRGNSTKTFYKYVISTDTWSVLANSPDFPRFSSATINLDQKGTFYHNAVDGKDYIYYINTWSGTPSSGVDSGVSSRYSFMIRYNINDDLWSTWDASDDAPVPRINYGSLQYNSSDGLIYVVRGDGTYDLWKFDPLGGTAGVGTGGKWIGPQIVNGGQNASSAVNYTLGTGSDVIWNGITGAGGYLYTIRGGNTAHLFRYDITANTWLQLANAPVNFTTDTKGTYANGFIYYFRGNSTREFYRYDVGADTWSATNDRADYSSNLYDGASLAYNNADGYIYALTGNGSSGFKRYDVALNTWTTLANMATGEMTYAANAGGRILSDGTNIFTMVGDGEKVFLKYTTGSNTWSALSSTPFVQYHGTDMTFANGKIYALAGYYRDEVWEYTIETDTWRKITPIASTTYERGPYNGASIEYAGGNSLYATLGQSLSEVLSLTISSNNYASQGTYISQPIDLQNIESWVSFAKNDLVPSNTSITYETRTGADGKNWDSWQEIVGTTITSDHHRYIQVRIVLASTDKINTPKVYDWSISYNSEDVLPSNPNQIEARSRRVGGELLASGSTSIYEHPYFSWSGASDSGSGIAGYYVCFGKEEQCVNPETDGVFQETAFYEANEALESGTYKLRIKTKDVNGNISTETWDAFTYIYSGVSPTISVSKTSKIDFDTGTNSDVSTSRIDGSLSLASTPGFWNEARVPTVPVYTYNDGELVKATYNNTTYFYSLVGSNRPNFYRYDPLAMTWTRLLDTPVNIYYGGELVEGPSGFLYASAGGVTSTFMRYDIAQNTWQNVSSAPQAFTYGTTLKYDGQRYIFATAGNDNSFFRYDTINNNWITLGTLNFGNPEFTYQSSYVGADSVFDGNNTLYITQGNGYPYFTKYTISDNVQADEVGGTWTPLAPSPSGSSSGGNMVYDSETNAIYLFTGNSKNFFYKYDIANDVWSRMPDSPATIGYGGSSVIYERYIYIQTGDYSVTFLRYNLDENSWDLPKRGIFKDPHYSNNTYYGFGGGTAITYDTESNAYLIRGAYDIRFEKYNPLTGVSSELAPLPVGGIDGAQLVFVSQENAIYYTPGAVRSRRINGKNNYFFKYNITTNTWSSLPNDLPPAQTYSGSSMIYDGSQYIYLTQANGGAVWWRYDRLATSGSRWSTALPTITGWAQNSGSRMLLKDGMIYSTRANGSNTFFRFSVAGNAWLRLADIPGNISSGSALVDGNDGYLYLTQGGNLSGYYRYKISGVNSNTWETMTSIPAQVSYGGGGAGMNAGNRVWVVAGTGTNTYSDGLYSYVVSSETNEVGFAKTGTYVSEPLDLVGVFGWANITVNYTKPQNTFVLVETRSSLDNIDWSDWTTASNERVRGNEHTYSIESLKNVFLQVRLTLSSTDQIFSPLVSDYTINYYQDIQAPTNPTSILAYSDNTKSTLIATDTWRNNISPYFEWPVAGEAGGASDNVGGSGVAGYYVYFGTLSGADAFADGTFQTSSNFTASGIVSSTTYYLKIKAIDNAEILPTDDYEAFVFKFDGTAPTGPSDIMVTPTGYTAVDSYSFTWESDAFDAHSNLLKLQYRTGGDEAGVWFDIPDPQTVSLTIPNANHTIGAYQSGKNTLLLRAVDMAGNTSSAIAQDYYFSASAPAPPRDLAVTPETSDNNSFSFSWLQPESFIGEASKLKYYYSINSLPTAYNTVETTLTAAGPGPFATQKGSNHLYVVAKDEAGNIDYNLYAAVEFFANTSSPSVPGNVQAFDTSDREAAEYSVAVKWTVPQDLNLGNFAGYVIYRSLDNVTFEEVASTTGSAYVDTNLQSQLYYYYVKAKDKTNNYSIASSTASLTPTGRYTTAPLLVGVPKVTVQSFAASFTWATNRVASSFVEFGESISLGETNGQVDSVTDHTVDIQGLSAEKKHFYRVKYIDPDGNIGTSEILNFTTLPPPTISEVLINNIVLKEATVSWKTNVSATCTLTYGAGTVEETSGGSSHVERITGLSADSTYTINIDCIDTDLNEFSSDEYTFITPKQPTASDVTVQNEENVDLPTLLVSYKTNVPTTTLVYFKHNDESSQHTFLTSEKVTEHEASLPGLEPSKEYTLTIAGIDENGIDIIPLEQKITTKSDSRPPKIIVNRSLGKVLGRGNNSQANVYIKIETDEETTVKVRYAKGVVTSTLEQSASSDSLNTYHLITIPAEPGQVYSYEAEVYDTVGNLTKSEITSVVVEKAKASATEVITGTFSARFGWMSNLWTK